MKYEESLKKHCVNLVVKEGQTKASVTIECNLSQGLIKHWLDAHERSISSSQIAIEQRQRELEKEVKLLKKENEFLKKASAFFAKNQNF